MMLSSSFVLSAKQGHCVQIISLFPLLQPLVAVLGWDLLSGKTTARRKLMQLMWTSKSQVLRLEEFPIYGKHSDEVIFFIIIFNNNYYIFLISSF